MSTRGFAFGRKGGWRGKDLHAAVLQSGREDKQVGLVRDGDERRLHLDEVGHLGKVVRLWSGPVGALCWSGGLRGSRAVRTYKNATLPLRTTLRIVGPKCDARPRNKLLN